MLVIERLRYKNFLSSSNIWTEIDFQGHKTTLVVGKNGSGKAQPLSSLVLTINGWQKMGDLKVGDYIIGDDGQPSKIKGVFPQGIKDCYEITFADGRATKCCGDHLWKVWGMFDSKWQWKIIPLNEIISKPQYKQAFSNNLYVPLFAGNEYDNDKSYLIDPYLLGVLIGDGSFVSSSIILTSADQEIIDIVSILLQDTCQKISYLQLSKIDDRYGYRINYSLDSKCS